MAEVSDSIEDVHTGGLADGKDAVMLIIFRQPGANIIDTVDRVIKLMPQLQAEVPAGMQIADRHGPHHHHPLQRARCRNRRW